MLSGAERTAQGSAACAARKAMLKPKGIHLLQNPKACLRSASCAGSGRNGRGLTFAMGTMPGLTASSS